jgi:hypothetical protein
MSIKFLSGINVDSNTLFVDDANNRVGIGTASPSHKLDINGGASSDYYQLNTSATPTLSPGMMRWNDSDGTAEIALKYGDVVLQLGQ